MHVALMLLCNRNAPFAIVQVEGDQKNQQNMKRLSDVF
jgi:hypothetical protein